MNGNIVWFVSREYVEREFIKITAGQITNHFLEVPSELGLK